MRGDILSIQFWSMICIILILKYNTDKRFTTNIPQIIQQFKIIIFTLCLLKNRIKKQILNFYKFLQNSLV